MLGRRLPHFFLLVCTSRAEDWDFVALALAGDFGRLSEPLETSTRDGVGKVGYDAKGARASQAGAYASIEMEMGNVAVKDLDFSLSLFTFEDDQII